MADAHIQSPNPAATNGSNIAHQRGVPGYVPWAPTYVLGGPWAHNGAWAPAPTQRMCACASLLQHAHLQGHADSKRLLHGRKRNAIRHNLLLLLLLLRYVREEDEDAEGENEGWPK